MSEQMTESDQIATELADALANALADRPQHCGHSSDPMCCPYENFPTLAAFFDPAPNPAATCGLDEGYGKCGMRPGHETGLHAVPIGGGSDPIADPEVWFVFGEGVKKPGFRSLRLKEEQQ